MSALAAALLIVMAAPAGAAEDVRWCIPVDVVEQGIILDVCAYVLYEDGEPSVTVFLSDHGLPVILYWAKISQNGAGQPEIDSHVRGGTWENRFWVTVDVRPAGPVEQVVEVCIDENGDNEGWICLPTDLL
ncbi:MAG TPA: hypothetical protein VIG64_03230 [Actinomycetota bacterium]